MPKLSKRSRILLIIAAAVVVLLLVGARLLSAYVDWLWFGEVGARQVFDTVLLTRAALFLAVGAIVGGVLAAGLLIAYRTRPVFVPVSGAEDPLARYRSAIVGRLRLFGIGIPVFVGAISGAAAQGDWQRVQLFLHGTSFGQQDPEFGHDIGFYAFDLPFLNWALGWLFVTVALAFIGALIAHYIFGGIRLAGRGGQLSAPARVQLSVTIGVFVLLKAVEYFLDRYNLLLSDNPLFTGASYTDLNAVLPAKLILLCISVFCAIAFFAGAFLRNLQLPAIALVLLVLSGILVGAAWPAVLEQFSVKPNANERESASIQRNMDATKSAFGLNNVQYQNYPGKSDATPGEVRADQGTVPNIRLLDPTKLADTFTQRVGRENFYAFPTNLDIDRYTVNGKKQDYIVAAKEVDTRRLAENQGTWINRHLVYTHGNGFTAAPANTIDRAVVDANSDGGYPLASTSDTQNPSGAGIKVTEPRIYFGELAGNDYAIAGGEKGKAPGEYDTATDRSYLYQGKGGVPVDGWFNRLVFAAEFRERNILFSNQISSGSKIMYNRNPRDRVQKMAPWLTVDGDPYPAVVNGRIKWIVDGYTTLNNFPYAQQTPLGDATQDSLTGVARQPNNKVNYMRNSVKATVDAFDGNVDMYATQDREPVLNAWQSVFPGLVKPSAAIPPELREHFRYPEDMFKIQRDLLARYHVSNPAEFYSNQTFWEVPGDPTQEGGAPDNRGGPPQPPYYIFAEVPGADGARFQLTSSLVALGRQYLGAWMSASSDPKDYGALRVLRLPTDRGQTDGPVQVQNRFQSDPRVAQDRTLFGNQAVTPIFGNLLTLPVAQGFLYVEPVYIRQRNQNSYPQLARVLVAYGQKIGFGSTLQQALDSVFGQGTGQAATSPKDEGGQAAPPVTQPSPSTGQPPAAGGPLTPEMSQALAEVKSSLERLRTAQQKGDFSGQGEALAALDAAAKRFDAAQQGSAGRPG